MPLEETHTNTLRETPSQQYRNDIQRLLPRHFEIMELTLQGNCPSNIAAVLGMNPNSVALIIRSPLFQDELARRRSMQQKISDEDLVVKQVASATETARKILEDASPLAAQLHRELLSSPSKKIAQASANSILDRVLDKKVDKHQGGTVIIEKGAIELLQLAIIESGESKVVRNVPAIERKDLSACG